MPLYDVTYSPARLVNPRDAESFEVLVAIRKRIHPASWDRVVQTIDDAIDRLSRQSDTKLAWGKMASLFGHSSMQPKKDIDHLWEKVNNAMTTDKLTNLGVGGLLRWRLSIREELWLAYRQESENIDPETGKKITISTYWIDKKFVPPNIKPTGLDVLKLQERWGSKSDRT